MEITQAEQDLLNELVYGSKDLKVRFLSLIQSSIDYVNECEQNDDEPEMSEQYLRFLNYIKNKEDQDPNFSQTYYKPIGLFEKMINDGLNNFGEDTILDHIDTNNINNIICQSADIDPMSALELEFSERTAVLWATEIDLVWLFESFLTPSTMTLEGYTWEFFKDCLTGKLIVKTTEC